MRGIESPVAPWAVRDRQEKGGKRGWRKIRFYEADQTESETASGRKKFRGCDGRRGEFTARKRKMAVQE